jgi:hypothetical protein
MSAAEFSDNYWCWHVGVDTLAPVFTAEPDGHLFGVGGTTAILGAQDPEPLTMNHVPSGLSRPYNAVEARWRGWDVPPLSLDCYTEPYDPYSWDLYDIYQVADAVIDSSPNEPFGDWHSLYYYAGFENAGAVVAVWQLEYRVADLVGNSTKHSCTVVVLPEPGAVAAWLASGGILPLPPPFAFAK